MQHPMKILTGLKHKYPEFWKRLKREVKDCPLQDLNNHDNDSSTPLPKEFLVDISKSPRLEYDIALHRLNGCIPFHDDKYFAEGNYQYTAFLIALSSYNNDTYPDSMKSPMFYSNGDSTYLYEGDVIPFDVRKTHAVLTDLRLDIAVIWFRK